jgi:hypothetical protein
MAKPHQSLEKATLFRSAEKICRVLADIPLWVVNVARAVGSSLMDKAASQGQARNRAALKDNSAVWARAQKLVRQLVLVRVEERERGLDLLSLWLHRAGQHHRAEFLVMLV